MHRKKVLKLADWALIKIVTVQFYFFSNSGPNYYAQIHNFKSEPD